MCTDCGWQEALGLAQSIQERMRHLPGRALGFVEIWKRIVTGMEKVIANREHVFPRQVEALYMIQKDLARWEHVRD